MKLANTTRLNNVKSEKPFYKTIAVSTNNRSQSKSF